MGMTAANLAMDAAIPVIGLVITAIGLVTAGVIAHKEALERQSQEIRDNISAFTEENKALQNVHEQLQNENIKREELNGIIDANLDKYEAERIALLNDNEARAETIKLIEEEKRARAQEIVDTGLTEYEDALDRVNNGYEEVEDTVTKVLGLAKDYTPQIAELVGKSYVEYAKDYEEQRTRLIALKQDLIEYRRQLIDSGKKDSNAFKNTTKAIEEVEAGLATINNRYKEDKTTISNYNNALKETGQHYDETTQSIERGAGVWGDTLKAQEAAIKKTQEATKYTADERKELDDLKEQYNITDDAIYDYIEAHQEELEAEGNSTAAYYSAIEALALEHDQMLQTAYSAEELSKANSQLEQEISSLATALTEQEKNGSIALKTQLELIDAGYAAALAYDEETGYCKLNAEAVQKIVEAKIQERIATINAARTSLVEKLKAEATAAATTAKVFLELAKAKSIANESSLTQGATSGRAYDDPSKSYSATVDKMKKDAQKTGKDVKDVLADALAESNTEVQKLDAELNALEGSLKQIKSAGVQAFGTIGQSASKAGSGAKKAASSTKDAADATKKAEEEAKKAIEETTKAIQTKINALDEEIAQIEKQTTAIQNQITALEKTQSQYERVFSFITKKIENRIKEIEAEKDAAVSASEAIVKAKEEEKDAILESIEAEISALEEEKEAREK